MSTKHIEIRSRWTNACLWEGGVEDTGFTRRNLGSAIKAALLSGAVLRGDRKSVV